MDSYLLQEALKGYLGAAWHLKRLGLRHDAADALRRYRALYRLANANFKAIAANASITPPRELVRTGRVRVGE